MQQLLNFLNAQIAEFDPDYNVALRNLTECDVPKDVLDSAVIVITMHCYQNLKDQIQAEIPSPPQEKPLQQEEPTENFVCH